MSPSLSKVCMSLGVLMCCLFNRKVKVAVCRGALRCVDFIGVWRVFKIGNLFSRLETRTKECNYCASGIVFLKNYYANGNKLCQILCFQINRGAWQPNSSFRR